MAKGGFRLRAGRPGWRVPGEHCRRIDVRHWRRTGTLRDGYRGSWIWRVGDEPAGSIGYAVDADHVTLDYIADGAPIVERVPLDRTPCRFGGSRAWFRCPRCGERVALLYMRGTRFACRHCQRVSYASQSEDAVGRTWRKQAQAEAHLGEGWARPKGMHRSTHARLMRVITDCEAVRDHALFELWERLAPA